MKENLQAFLYLLMRDKLPTGEVVDLIKNHIEKHPHDQNVYCAPLLAEYAGELADRIINAGKDVEVDPAGDADLLTRVMEHVTMWCRDPKLVVLPMKTPIDQAPRYEIDGAPYCAITKDLVTDDEERVSKCAAAISLEIEADLKELEGKHDCIYVFRPYLLIRPTPTVNGGGKIRFRSAKRVVTRIAG